MSLTNAASNTWTGSIPAQSAGSTVYYYIRATSVSGKSQVRPMPAPAGYWKFNVQLSTGLVEPITITEVQLLKPYPNPSKGITCIPVTKDVSVYATVSVKDILGRTVDNIFTGVIPQGKKNYFVNTEGLTSGVYFVELKTKSKCLVQKLIVRYSAH